MTEQDKHKLYEELRVLHKERGWERKHIRNIMDILARDMESAPDQEECDPNQLDLFDEQ